MSRLVHVFPKSDLRCSHIGLTKVAIKSNRDPRTLDNGDFLFFLNTKQNQFKLLGPNGILVHWKAPDNRRVEIRAIEFLPEAFNGKEFDFNIAVKKSLVKTLGRKRAGLE